eukprot:scpid56650/ scgid34903/ DnaJ homolog subfamily C member 21; DnaJ homolog subfamily A member 5
MASSKRKVRCHYEVLEVAQDADDAVLKKAYRKKALKYHPDKNPDDVEESTRLFREVQQAYDVLSDPQERAWYDKHRDVILAGGGDEYEDDALDLGPYFSASSYSGFGDGESGFYAVYSNVFSTLTNEEAPFDSDTESEDENGIEEGDLSEFRIGKVPQFGRGDSPYELVVGPFYAYWSNFATKKSFVWVEKYDTRQAPDRRTRRLMEQENKKLRDEARKRRTDAVRTLVDWLKRRDPRIKARAQYNKELEAERARRDKERRREQIMTRNKELEEFKVAEWSSMAELQHQLESVEKGVMAEFGGDSSDEADGLVATAASSTDQGADGAVVDPDAVYEYVQDPLYCLACDKSFSSEKSLENHQRSKKHKENVALLRKELEQDDDDASDEEDGSLAEMLAQLQKEEADAAARSQATSGGGKKSKKAKKKKRQAAAAAASVLDDDNDQSDDELAAALRGEASAAQQEAPAPSSASAGDGATADTQDTKPSQETRKPKSSKKAQSSAASATRTPSELDLICVGCSMEFSTRNKMFQHLKETGHAQPVSAAGGSSSSSSSKKSKKGKKRKT